MRDRTQSQGSEVFLGGPSLSPGSPTLLGSGVRQGSVPTAGDLSGPALGSPDPAWGGPILRNPRPCLGGVPSSRTADPAWGPWCHPQGSGAVLGGSEVCAGWLSQALPRCRFSWSVCVGESQPSALGPAEGEAGWLPNGVPATQRRPLHPPGGVRDAGVRGAHRVPAVTECVHVCACVWREGACVYWRADLIPTFVFKCLQTAAAFVIFQETM